ncbi:MAG: hypothetical protein E6R03_02845 [Hyphomicrobiaceae bacterium]|nr:MAG: hypothetical protein E6R03_02845 [Hyphomicrobiaceae bacterium]
MDLNPYGAGGPVWYRIRLGTRVGSKVAAWIQRKRFFFFWRDWAPMSNARISVGNLIIDRYADLERLVAEYEAIAKHEEEAIKFVEGLAGDDGISKPFKGPSRPKEARLPDNAEEVMKVIKAIKEGKEDRRRRMGYDPQRLSRSSKPDKKQGSGGPRSVYTEAELNSVTDALNRSWSAEDADFKIPFKGLHDQPKPDQGKGNQNQNQKGGNKSSNDSQP